MHKLEKRLHDKRILDEILSIPFVFVGHQFFSVNEQQSLFFWSNLLYGILVSRIQTHTHTHQTIVTRSIYKFHVLLLLLLWISLAQMNINKTKSILLLFSCHYVHSSIFLWSTQHQVRFMFNFFFIYFSTFSSSSSFHFDFSI